MGWKIDIVSSETPYITDAAYQWEHFDAPPNIAFSEVVQEYEDRGFMRVR